MRYEKLKYSLWREMKLNYDFRRIEDVLDCLEESNWNSVYQHENALEVSLTPESIDDIFEMITKDTELPLIYESGCGGGVTTSQIYRY